MSIETWGLMPKSQIDNETIEEAIHRIVAEHEHDPTSHMGENEAIEAHRKSEIIDHLAGSVLSDKFSNQDFNIDFTFQSLDGLGTSGGADTDAMRARLYVESGVYNTSSIDFIPLEETRFSATEFSILMQFVGWFEWANTATHIVEFGRVGFQIENNRIRGKTWLNASETITYSDWYTIDMTDIHVLRAQYFKLENVVRFYCDGVLIDEIVDTFIPLNQDMRFLSLLTRNTSSDNYFYMLGLKLALFEK